MPSTNPAPSPVSLPPIAAQLERLIDLGVPGLAGVSVPDFRSLCPDSAATSDPHPLLAVHPSLVPARRLIEAVSINGRKGFLVTDMQDVDDFVPTADVAVPDDPLYLVAGLDRGDDMANWSPEEAAVEIAARGRSPLTLNEGLSWLVQDPGALERNHCFMTIASRKPKVTGGFDARTPALWLSNGTGRDGAAMKHHPKAGWCWWRNRHTWLGFASCAARSVV